MRKLAFEHAGFEMPSLSMVNLEKENDNIVFATPKTVYKGSNFNYDRQQALRIALADETSGSTGSWTYSK